MSSAHDRIIRVLLVEDDPDDHEHAMELLRDIGEHGPRYQLDWVTRYDDGLAALEREEHDVCLLDYYLGERDGLDLLKAAVRSAVRVPIVFLTGRGDREVEKLVLEAGAADYLAKSELDAPMLERSIRHSVERGRSLEALRDRERQLRAVFEGALDAILITDDDGRYVDGNEAALALLGVPRAQLLAMSVRDLAPEAAKEAIDAMWRRFLDEGRMSGELEVRRPDGSPRTVEFRATANFRPGRHLSALRDVTERRIAEGHQRRLAAIVESAADAISGITLDGIIDYWSPAAERMYGYTSSEVLGQSERIVFSENAQADFEDLLTRVRRGEALRDTETVRRRKDGSTFAASVTVSPVLRDGSVIAASLITRDISEKKRLEAHLAVSDRMASVGTLVAGLAHEINGPLAAVIANLDFVAHAVGLPDAHSTAATTPEDERPAMHAVTLYETDEALVELVADFFALGVTRGESLLMIATAARSARLEEALRARGLDTERLRATERLVVLDAHDTLSKSMADGVPDRGRLAASVGRELARLARAGTHVRAYGEMVDLLFRAGEARAASSLEEMWNELGRSRELSMLCAYDASSFRSAEQVRHVCASHGHIVAAERSEPDVDLPWTVAQTRQLAAELGRGRGADAWRDGAAQSERAACPPSLREPLEDARASADRIRHVVRDLKLFSRPDVERRGPVELRPIIESSLRMAWNEIRHRARLVKDYGDVPPVDCSDARLGQVFLNLIVNAAHSIREGDAERNEIRIVTRTDEEGRAVTEISDTGSGIAPGAQHDIFEPFFTTKPIGVGTGLGLSICRRIVHEFGGSITVASAVGRGTTFKVTLPAARAGVGALASVRPPSSPAARRGRVLVVDDEPLIARAVKRVLSSDHDVTSARSGTEALELLRTGSDFDVIICDMMMPQMTGMEFYEHLVESMPSRALRIVFLTGGAFTRSAKEFLDRVPNHRMEKPFDTVHLRRLVNERIACAESGRR
ncbi:MAG: PAS domain S-box protein [Myxococcota bacterium]|nr:PAS domain S-box protein [Myxococcota bacterium]